MKKLILISSLMAICLTTNAKTPLILTEGQPAIVYALPKTQLNVEVETEKLTQQPGVFYRYSERYLATTKVITEPKVSFRIKSIKVRAVAVPDPNRTYSVEQENGSANISINSKGILCGVNVPVVPKKVHTNVSVLPVKETSKVALLPLGEEYMMAGSEAKLAEGAAKQIYRIRESRLGLLTADVEKMPADGASLKTMLNGMDQMERELTELFIGKTISETKSEVITVFPDSAMEGRVLFRFSALRGMVAADDLSGMPYYISVKPTNIPNVVADPKSKAVKTILNYVLPATASVTITDGVNECSAGLYSVAQLGKVIPLSDKLLNRSQAKISIDPQTGQLLSIQ
jgi:hypothetical protein